MSVEVVAYTDPDCPHCRRLKEYLGSQDIPFENRDVTADPHASDAALMPPCGRSGSPPFPRIPVPRFLPCRRCVIR